MATTSSSTSSSSPRDVDDKKFLSPPMTPAALCEHFPRLREDLSTYASSAPQQNGPLRYGTAGIRANATRLDAPLFRLGILAAFRSRATASQITGAMITASHNRGEDNGVKLVDPSGAMLSSDWETTCDDLVNARSPDDVLDILAALMSAEGVDVAAAANVFLARDTRESSEHLAEVCREGVLAAGGNVLDFGLQTTPQLHHVVRMWNKTTTGPLQDQHWASEQGYYDMLVSGFTRLVASCALDEIQAKKDNNVGGVDSSPTEKETTLPVAGPTTQRHDGNDDLYIDAAHGVGASQVNKLAHCLFSTTSTSTTTSSTSTTSSGTSAWHIRNTPDDGELNVECGAEYCQKARAPPSGFSAASDKGKRCCSLDGDADRLVYHYFDLSGSWHLLDGDKIAAFIATFFREHILTLNGLVPDADLSFGVVQTAYANGAATTYIKALGLSPVVAKTGVKYCHQMAVEAFDIGLYMEANGHGTVVFRDDAVVQLRTLEANADQQQHVKQAAAELLAAYQILNQSVGDAMSLILMIEALLRWRGWSIAQWDAIYTDIPSRQTKLAVADRNVVQCNASETQVIAPSKVQDEIDALVGQVDPVTGRAFVRPSGTEDVVRIYAEAATEAQADALALGVAEIVHRLAGGVGTVPTSFLA